MNLTNPRRFSMLEEDALLRTDRPAVPGLLDHAMDAYDVIGAGTDSALA